MKRILAVTLFLAALVQGAHAQQRLPEPIQNLPRAAATPFSVQLLGQLPDKGRGIIPPSDFECDISGLVRLAGDLVGDPEPSQDTHQCLSTPLVCAEQQAAYDATKHAQLMFNLAHVVRLCRHAGY